MAAAPSWQQTRQASSWRPAPAPPRRARAYQPGLALAGGLPQVAARLARRLGGAEQVVHNVQHSVGGLGARDAASRGAALAADLAAALLGPLLLAGVAVRRQAAPRL